MAFHMQDEEQRVVFTRLAVVVVGWAVPDRSEKEHATVQTSALASCAAVLAMDRGASSRRQG